MNIEYKKLAEIATISDSLHQTPDYSKHGIPMVRVTDIKGGMLSLRGCLKVNEDTYKKFTSNHEPTCGDIVISRVGTYGVFSYVSTNEHFCLGQNTAIITPKINPKYLYYCLLSQNIKIQIEQRVVGSTQKTLSLKNIKELEIPCFVENIHSNIAHILGCFDDKICLNTKINDNLLQQARALFRQWLSNTTGELHCLSEFASINQETYSPKNNWDSINYLDTSSITDGTISEIQYINPSVDKLPSRARRILKQGDIVFSTVRPNQLHYGIVSNPLPNMLGSTGFAVIRSNSSTIPNEIIYLALTDPSFIEQMQQIAEQSVSTFPSIRPSDLDACCIPEPQDGEDKVIAAIQALFAESAANNEENNRLSLLRDTLLPKLMSGELDVSDMDI